MNNEKLRIVVGYPLHIELSEKPEYKPITIKTSQISGCDLDYSLAISVLTVGVLFLTFQVDGRGFLVSYEHPGEEKIIWSPSTNKTLAETILHENHPSFIGENFTEGLQQIIEQKLGSSVESLRLNRNTV